MTRLAPLALALTLGLAPDPSPTPTAAPSAPPAMIDLRFLRMKISAGDLYSAESILQVHRAEKGEDAEYLMGTAWLARGAALVGDWGAASRYATAARDLALAVFDAEATRLLAKGLQQGPAIEPAFAADAIGPASEVGNI